MLNKRTSANAWFFTILISAVLILELLYLLQSCYQKPKDQVNNQEATPEVAPPVTQADFLGDQSCRSCHAQAYDDWKNSHHDQAMQPARPKTVLGNFENATFTSQGVRYRFYQKMVSTGSTPKGQMVNITTTK
ncbi:MAG: hypothetical protein HC876_19375 [Chloroflexaceae bacterium]|nr:hypothetical protein [Chloroflexaceae bacterium]